MPDGEKCPAYCSYKLGNLWVILVLNRVNKNDEQEVNDASIVQIEKKKKNKKEA